ncbi:Lrp/AsnC family transcriptional regulator [Nocardioides donggukensis]|uniref:Lrp/AsnC family transcriptional regulator n=1 Tax=Nocardioides donggukensis TaxID=2774019 RepID=A0A927Q3N5_9ACTN|nr:Lrp/AsnC family transcriptional regulator [Nocardioides donggukensis]MBD8870766.1 Lrp/AsnC family transcriptional regulator [Nocardioides donggukensis]
MTGTRSTTGQGAGRPSNIVRPALDAVDTAIIEELALDARLPNNALADRVGVAASTCLGRVRALREAGVIRGFHADVDPELTGRPIQAMVQVRMQSHARGQLVEFMQSVAYLPGVRNTYLLAGSHDFFIHVAMPDTESLREFVIAHLSGNRDVALTETNLIFSHSQAWA